MIKKPQRKSVAVASVLSGFQYAIQFEPLPEGGYDVHIPAIPEICTYGRTLREAEQMAKEAIRCYLESELKLISSRAALRHHAA